MLGGFLRPVYWTRPGRRRRRLQCEQLEVRDLCTLTGIELRTLVSVPPSSKAGTGETIDLIEVGRDPTLQADVDTYCRNNGLPSIRVVEKQPLGAVADNTGNGWDIETTLDVGAAHTIALGATINVVESPDASLVELTSCATYAAERGAQVVSMSYAAPSFGFTPFDDLINYAQYPHTLFVASAGDVAGFINVPAADNHVLDVGAVDVAVDSRGRLRGERVASWSPSGLSDDNGHRSLPDIVAPGGVSAALQIWVHGQVMYIYGTSESAPIAAAEAALAEIAAGGIRWDAPDYRAFLAAHRSDLRHPRGGAAGLGDVKLPELLRDAASIDLPAPPRKHSGGSSPPPIGGVPWSS